MLKPYACQNRPAQAGTYLAQDGYGPIFHDGFDEPFRTPKLVTVAHSMSDDCKYGATTADPRCSGCKWSNSNEKQVIRP